MIFARPQYQENWSNELGYALGMRVRVLFFGVLKDVFSRSEEVLELPAGATVSGLLDAYRRRAPEQHSSVWPALAVAVNQQYATVAEVLHEDDEVALLPPVSGGSQDGGPDDAAEPYVAFTREVIEAGALLAELKHAEDGAVVVFDGIVRNNTRGRRTLYLDYEAYEAMALAEMRKLVAGAQSRFSVREIALVHRLGRIKIGETSVLIVVASAHRGAAFDACRFVIDTLKKTVPVWKKEFFEDGAVWSDGEPFPAELNPHGGTEQPLA